MRTRVVIAAALLAIAAALVLAARPHEATAEERVDRITTELRCPVCQGLSVKDSPSETARQMRNLVAERVREGKTDAEIEAEFRAAYGDWVLLSPPVASWSGLVWLAPLAVIGAGFILATARVRGGTPARAAEPTAAQVAALRERVARDEAADG
ncbi:MAG TPA: cytochrome c-type biogenesis protein CcmH [Candidatus Limnocylindria bacterium]|jgi:cytochrome c-type biogenesis protein CcmH|nr:cytochrome c-type biogenesis protein CcmH [Candidatus Limnocylindria bacterium]